MPHMGVPNDGRSLTRTNKVGYVSSMLLSLSESEDESVILFLSVPVAMFLVLIKIACDDTAVGPEKVPNLI